MKEIIWSSRMKSLRTNFERKNYRGAFLFNLNKEDSADMITFLEDKNIDYSILDAQYISPNWSEDTPDDLSIVTIPELYISGKNKASLSLLNNLRDNPNCTTMLRRNEELAEAVGLPYRKGDSPMDTKLDHTILINNPSKYIDKAIFDYGQDILFLVKDLASISALLSQPITNFFGLDIKSHSDTTSSNDIVFLKDTFCFKYRGKSYQMKPNTIQWHIVKGLFCDNQNYVEAKKAIEAFMGKSEVTVDRRAERAVGNFNKSLSKNLGLKEKLLQYTGRDKRVTINPYYNDKLTIK